MAAASGDSGANIEVTGTSGNRSGPWESGVTQRSRRPHLWALPSSGKRWFCQGTTNTRWRPARDRRRSVARLSTRYGVSVP